MKKLLIIFSILISFILGGAMSYFYCNNENNKKTVFAPPRDEIFIIDKTNFNTYSKSLLIAINKCAKEEKRLDIKSEHDLINYIDIYFGADFKTIMKDMTKEQKGIADDIRLTSLNLTYLLEAIQDKNVNDINVQHRILTDLLTPYKL